MATAKVLTKKSDIVKKVVSELENNGEMFFSTGNINQDYEIIAQTLEHQGYWSGNRERYYFDKYYNIARSERRWLDKY